ncbi:hypothetical protein [Kribbella sp. VKM Ac-2568]|uniref:hypothetical protein n=1 Tax=Kribbella sp. VKM Ac-2568 TaxID=2512219 RepID=UPI0010D0F494|nr:hypothetical protein [Kribbella sp. VKM Ac-2568]TCM37578.1 hypothetical protein EV648_119129 [Kribbella sp. VKM Ac-2568]
MRMLRFLRALPVLVVVGAALSMLFTAPADAREVSPTATQACTYPNWVAGNWYAAGTS